MLRETSEETLEKTKEVKETLKVEKLFDKRCRQCPILYYWITEGCEPEEGQILHCSHLMRTNMEFRCTERPRHYDDDFIGEGLPEWL